MYRMTYSTSNSFFNHQYHHQYHIFLKQACHANPGPDKNEEIKLIYFNTLVSKVSK